ncbi:molecular chaperone DnaJ, partial [Mesorhizobium sp. M7A.F.Ca.CA.004.11.2.1]
MGAIIAFVALLLLLLGAVTIFLRAEPAKLASTLRTLGPALLAVVGVAVLVVGREGIGG